MGTGTTPFAAAGLSQTAISCHASGSIDTIPTSQLGPGRTYSIVSQSRCNASRNHDSGRPCLGSLLVAVLRTADGPAPAAFRISSRDRSLYSCQLALYGVTTGLPPSHRLRDSTMVCPSSPCVAISTIKLTGQLFPLSATSFSLPSSLTRIPMRTHLTVLNQAALSFPSHPVFKVPQLASGSDEVAEWSTITYSRFHSDVEKYAKYWTRVLAEDGLEPRSTVALW